MKIDKWNFYHAILMIISLIVSIIIDSYVVIVGVGILSFLNYWRVNFSFLSDFKPFGGYANWVTALRLLLFATCLLYSDVFSPIQFTVLMTSVVCLDALDGYLARRYNHSSRFGEFFDMEVDAFFVLGMCLFFYLSKDIPIWVLFPGALRYLFRIIKELPSKKNFEEKRRSYARYIAGVYFVILLVSILLPSPYLIYSLGLGSVLVSISFMISFFELFKWRDESTVL